ncbi:MAG: DUF861 domain-containing protein [Alphaproteobacteria bacterium]|nr:DUF861 domain-containing protein [Alphaproteobacteria bacterium]
MPNDHTPLRTPILRVDPDKVTLEPLELDPEGFQSPLPVQNYQMIFEDEDIGLAIGIWDTTTMQEAFGPYPGDEYITVLDGHFAMVDAEHAPIARAKAGDSVTFRNGVPSSWKQDGYLRKIYLTLNDPEGEEPEIDNAEGGFRVVEPGRQPSGKPDADGVTREVIFRNDAGTMTVTLCAFPAQALPVAPCQSHRLMRVLAGKVTLTEPSAAPVVFGSDTHAFLPRGTACAWDIAAGTVAVIVDITAT